MSAALAHLRYFVTDALDEWRHSPGPNLLATATLAAVLFVAGVNLLLLANLSERVGRWKTDLRVSVYLRDDAAAGDVDALYAKVAAVRGVARVLRVDKDEALRRFQASFKDLADVPSELGKNPLPASLEVALDSGPQARDTARDVGAACAGSSAVEEVRYDQEFLDRVDALLDVARWGGASLGLIVFAAVAFVVAGVLRLTVYARRDEIEIMHLVGAPPMLVRGPFLVAGLVQGLAGGMLALFLVEAARRAARAYGGGGRPSDLLDLAAGSPLPFGPACLIVGIGVALGFASAWFAVRDAREPAR
jgi:cell division transport system permease protein